MSSVISIQGAAQVLRPPVDGRAYLRGVEVAAQATAPGALLIEGGQIAAFSPDASAPVQIDAGGSAVIPGFVDCHTHLPFAGWRAQEYAMKIAGASYAEIALRGGGIAASARALWESTDAQVLAQSRELAQEMLEHGTTSFECKSGYGLSEDAERRSLALAGRLAQLVPQRTVRTALLAHAVPPGDTREQWMATAARLAHEVDAAALDIFVEEMAFGLRELLTMGRLAHETGRALRAHVEQFSTMRSVAPALSAGARSLDHLAAMHPDDLPALARAECAAVLLPAAELLGQEGVAPGHELAAAGAICALASDLNPGTSPVVSMPLVIALAVRRYRWDVKQAMAAATLNAAWVLGLSGELGSLEVGKRADVVVLDGPLEQVPYRLGHNPVAIVIAGGELVQVRSDQAWRVRGWDAIA